MKIIAPLLPTLAVLASSSLASPIALPPSGAPFYGDPPDATHPWGIHDRNRPQPKIVTPGSFSTQSQPGKPPSDAIVLFDGTAASLANWEIDKPESGPIKWVIKDGALEVVPKTGGIRTKQQFADCQLHVEWAAPKEIVGTSQGRGNSGIFPMGLPEIQVLDNYNNPTYADGSAGSIYGINPPLANALRPPGEFQSVDIIFRRPVHKDGKLVDPGYITVFVNGVLVQDHTPLEGPGGHRKRSKHQPFPEKGPLKLQDHSNPVRFRNIWYRELPPRPVEGGTDGGFLTAEVTMAKRKEIAGAIRADAAKLPADSREQMLRLAESLVYENDSATRGRFEKLAATYVSGIKALPAAQIEARKGEIQGVSTAFGYLVTHKIVADNFAPHAALQQVAKQQGWDQEKK